MINKLSEEILLAVKLNKPLDELIEKIGNISIDLLYDELNDADGKKAFWINIYNAYYLILKTQRKVESKTIYTVREIIIAGEKFSLDDIEHGILRKYRSKYSLGYLPKLLVSKLILSLAVDYVDYRIHFALNCGAKSCPPIAFYKRENIESQLKMARYSFLEQETLINDNLKIIETTSLFNWYKADFGGDNEIKNIIGDVFEKDLSSYSLKYTKYDWAEDLYNFSE